MFPVAFWLNPVGWAHIIAFGVLLPLAVMRARRKIVGVTGAPLPDRLRHFRGATVELTMLAAISLGVAWTQEMQLFPRVLPSWRDILAGLVAYAIAVGYMWPRWRRAVQHRSRVVHLYMPSNASERAWWLAVSVLAGVGEEIAWRGVQTGLLVAAMGRFVVGLPMADCYIIASLLSAVSFGGAHAVQGWRSASVIVVFALGFQLLVWLTGSLYVAMAVHVLYDITAGLQYGRLGRELGYKPVNVTAT